MRKIRVTGTVHGYVRRMCYALLDPELILRSAFLRIFWPRILPMSSVNGPGFAGD